ncbi:hypothetical protein DSECCO2_04480 [anaerobic digester metagenome]
MKKMPTAQDFKNSIRKKFLDAEIQKKSTVRITSGDLHRELGGYPGSNHRMPVCCEVMYNQMQFDDEIISAPPKGRGASLTIEYHIPRKDKPRVSDIPNISSPKPESQKISRFAEIAKLYPELSDLNNFESLLKLNPRNAIIDTRSITEKIIRKMCASLGYQPGTSKFAELISVIQNKGVLSRQTISYVQSIRILGNIAVHQEEGDEPFTHQDGLIAANLFQEFLDEVLEKKLI